MRLQIQAKIYIKTATHLAILTFKLTQ